MEIAVQEILIGLGTFFSGVGTILAKQKWLPSKNGNAKFPEKSDKTGGAKHISEEGLGRVVKIETALKEDFLQNKDHTLICENAQLKLKETLRNTIKEEFLAFKKDLESTTKSAIT
jgi:hypothetical protein